MGLSPESIEPVVEAYAAKVVNDQHGDGVWDVMNEASRRSWRRTVRQEVTTILTLAHEAGWVGPGEAPF